MRAGATRDPSTGPHSTSLLQRASCTWPAGLSALVRPLACCLCLLSLHRYVLRQYRQLSPHTAAHCSAKCSSGNLRLHLSVLAKDIKAMLPAHPNSASLGQLKLGSCAGDPEEVLADPMCGSGTLLIEAALMATHAAPGLARNFWPFFRCSLFVCPEAS